MRTPPLAARRDEPLIRAVHSLLFKGRALEKLSDPDAAARAYSDAASVKPDGDGPWLGLRSVYEHKTSAGVEQYIPVGLRLTEIYAAACVAFAHSCQLSLHWLTRRFEGRSDDAHRSQSALDRLVDFVRANGTKLQYARALSLQLPSSPVYSFLEGRLPEPAHTYLPIAEIHEAAEKERINKEIGERKTRLGARIADVTRNVKREVYATSKLEDMYRDVIDWTHDDAVRRAHEEKLLLRAYDTLLVLPRGTKAAKREQVWKLANDMVLIQHPFLLAWEIVLEWESG